MKKIIIALSVLSAFGAAAPAYAQDFSASPNYGNATLRTGFTPDPRTWSIQAGGDIDASRTIGGSCVGYISNSPDLRVNYTAGSLPLIISAVSRADTTLVVNAPNGRWYCDDDSAGGVNPRVRFNSPQSGSYEIWLGTYSSGGTQQATLRVSEIGE